MRKKGLEVARKLGVKGAWQVNSEDTIKAYKSVVK